MTYVLLFRGLNVGGRSAVKMPELAAVLTSLGLRGVRTYIQSGNAVVEYDLPEAALIALVRDGFTRGFGFACEVCAVSGEELARVVAELPFTAEEIEATQQAQPEVEHLYVYFLPEPPAPDALAALQGDGADGDRIALRGRALYLLCAGSVRNSKTAARIGKRLPAATARNWNTVRKLLDMASK